VLNGSIVVTIPTSSDLSEVSPDAADWPPPATDRTLTPGTLEPENALVRYSSSAETKDELPLGASPMPGSITPIAPVETTAPLRGKL